MTPTTLLELGVPVLDSRLASLHAFLLRLTKAGLLGELGLQALQLILQRLAATSDISHLPQGGVAVSLRPKDDLLLLVASRRGLDQRRPNRSVGANPS